MTSDQAKDSETYAIATLENNKIIVRDENQINRLREYGYFGTETKNQILELAPEEALLLLERGRLCIESSNKTNTNNEISQKDLITIFSKQNPFFYKKFLVYRDLRNRGYIIKKGFGKTAPYRLYPRGATPGKKESHQIIYPFFEIQELEIEELDAIVTQVRRLRKELILSVVDRQGDVTYYKAETMDLVENQLAIKQDYIGNNEEVRV